jgi:hypothetical protein
MTISDSEISSLTLNEPVDTELLTISKVVDPNGTSIVNRTTYQTSFRVSGINAEPKNIVWIVNGDDKLGEVQSNDTGDWETPLLSVTNFDCYKVRAIGQWGAGPVSLPKNFTVATETPTINEVLSQGAPISDNDTIHDNSVTLKGNAVPNQNAEAFNGETLLKSEPVDACGKYTIDLTDLEATTYKIHVKASNDKVSSTFNFTVLGDVPLSLDHVRDADGDPIPPKGTTRDTTLSAEGFARALEDVQLYNSGTLIEGAHTTTDDKGEWNIPFTVLPGSCELTAQVTYGAGETDIYPFDVISSQAPSDTKVHDSNGLINDNGNTTFTHVVVRGIAEAETSVKLKINGVIDPRQEPTDLEGRWARLVTELVTGTTYIVSSVRADDDTAESNTWTFSVI